MWPRGEGAAPANPVLTRTIAARVALALFVIALALGGLHVWRFVGLVEAGMAQHGPLDGQEGTLLHEARLILRGEPLYQPLQLNRVVGAPYPPVHAYALAGAERLAHGNAPSRSVEEGHLFFAGRLISLGAMVAAAIVAGLLAWRLGGSPLAGLLAAPLMLAAAPVQLWATRIKPDPLALALSAAGLLCAALALVRGQTGHGQSVGKGGGSQPALLILAALLFAAAYFTKQTYIAAPLAVGLALLLGGAPFALPWPAPRRLGRLVRKAPRSPLTDLRNMLGNRRPLLLFASTYLAAVGLSWVLLDIATSGQFTFHVWGLHPPEWWSFGRFLRYTELLLPALPLVALCVLGLSLLIWPMLAGRRIPDAARLLPLLYAALGTATVVGAGTVGSHHNHLLEPTLALTIGGCSVAGWLLPVAGIRPSASGFRGSEKRLGGEGWQTHLAPLGGLLAAGLLLVQGVSYIERPIWYGGEFNQTRDEDWQRFVELLASQPGEVLSDDVGLLLLAGKEPRYDDPATMGPASRSGLWDQSGLIREVEERRFDLILLHFDATEQSMDGGGRWSPEFIAALRANYDLLYRDRYFSYVPRE
jgi:hypothetical protein